MATQVKKRNGATNTNLTIVPVEQSIPDSVLEQAALDLEAKATVEDESSF